VKNLNINKKISIKLNLIKQLLFFTQIFLLNERKMQNYYKNMNLIDFKF